MALTDNCSVYAALHENGVNRLVDHLMYKRPSLFNYGTERMVEAAHAAAEDRRVQPSVCDWIEYAPEVRAARWDNPLVTEQDPFPVLGTDGLVGLDYCFQVVEFEVDFAPDTLDIGIETGQFAAHVEVCAGLGCPSDDEFDAVLSELDEVYAYLAEHGMTVDALTADEGLMREFGLPVVPEPARMNCFCLDVSVIGSVDLVDRPSSPPPVEIPQSPRFTVRSIDVDDVHGDEFTLPKGMQASIECYVHSFVQLGLLPALSRAVESITAETLRMEVALFDLDLTDVRGRITFPESDDMVDNPELLGDEFRVCVDVDVSVGEGGA